MGGGLVDRISYKWDIGFSAGDSFLWISKSSARF